MDSSLPDAAGVSAALQPGPRRERALHDGSQLGAQKLPRRTAKRLLKADHVALDRIVPVLLDHDGRGRAAHVDVDYAFGKSSVLDKLVYVYRHGEVLLDQ